MDKTNTDSSAVQTKAAAPDKAKLKTARSLKDTRRCQHLVPRARPQQPLLSIPESHERALLARVQPRALAAVGTNLCGVIEARRQLCLIGRVVAEKHVVARLRPLCASKALDFKIALQAYKVIADALREDAGADTAVRLAAPHQKLHAARICY